MQNVVLTPTNAADWFAKAAASLPPYPDGFVGRGVVIAAGGIRYFPCAWVCINMLRKLGCMLQVEVWHLGPKEITLQMQSLLKPLGVTFRDAHQVRMQHPVRILNGWEIKPYPRQFPVGSSVQCCSITGVPLTPVDGAVPIDNNISEREMKRCQRIGQGRRKNSERPSLLW